MKRIIAGLAYDTDTATLVHTGSHDHEASGAWWSLYRNPSGVFFEVAAGHDGVVESWIPLTDAQAQAWLERHANHLVEQYFGEIPEAQPRQSDLRFSRRTVIAAIEVIEHTLDSHAKMTRFFLKLGSDLSTRCDGGSLADRCNHLIKYFDEDPWRRLESGDPIGAQLIEAALSLFPDGAPEDPYEVEHTGTRGQARLALVRALDLDGFTVTDKALHRTLPAELGLPQTQDDVTRLLDKHGFAMLKGHLNQALVAHGRGEWASANAQLRTFYEGLLDEIAVKIDPPSASLPSTENRRARLGQLGFLKTGLNEWSTDGKNFISGLFKRLHPSGSHPGLSDQDDSTFRRHIVLITAKLLLVRFDNWGH